MSEQVRLTVFTLFDEHDVVIVTFRHLAGEYYLARNQENFAEVLAVLKESARSGEAVMVTLDLTTILDAEACS